MEAPDQEGAQHPYYDQIYAVVEGIYRPQIETQFEEQFQAVAVSQVSAFMYETIIEELVFHCVFARKPGRQRRGH